MPERLIGPAREFTQRRDECEAAIEQLTGHDVGQAKVIEGLRRQLGGELADLVVTAARLQPKARLKLGPGLWWVTERSLQQATAWQVARLKSRWYGDRPVHDLCCGIGGDAIQIAQRGPVVAVDSDPTMVAMAAANLARHDATREQMNVRHEDACRLEIPHPSAIHIDPDRRADGGRTTHPDHFQPSWPQLLQIIADSDCAVVKLAPATRIADTGPGAAHRCWISLQRSVREQSWLLGEAIERAGVESGSRSAVSLDATGAASWFAPSRDEISSGSGDTVVKPQSMLIDPDPSIRAAGLSETFARQHGFQHLGSPSGFLTCENIDRARPQRVAMAVIGNVVWTGACDDRKLRRELRLRGFYPETVKVRGTDHDPAKLVKRYRACGEQPITLWIGRAGDRVYAAFTR
jgi:hypothetical protein